VAAAKGPGVTDFNPIDPFPVMTPYGPATCIGLYPSDDCEWATFNERTQEMWWFKNEYIRRRCNVTNGRESYSPFARINKVQRMHIERYIRNGWLPADYDPLNTETWPM
jgi:hypothetical protein